VKTPHRARRLALQGLCCCDVQGPRAVGLVEEFIRDSTDPASTVRAALEMFREALGARDSSDTRLARHARHWDLGRLALVDRNILRLGVWEMLSGRTPPRVVIAEALRLAEEFSTAESPRFVNGILDAVYREQRAERGGDGGGDPADDRPS